MDKTKRQLRAEAVDRLDKVKSATDESLLAAVLGCHDGVTLHGAEKLFALKALLIDDEPPEGDALEERNHLIAQTRNSFRSLARERDYWREQVQLCLDAAYPPSHSPERRYAPEVMGYPDRDGCTTPSTLVCAVIDGLRDERTEQYMGIVKEATEFKAERNSLREKVKRQAAQLADVQKALEKRNGELKPRWQKELRMLEAERDELKEEVGRLEQEVLCEYNRAVGDIDELSIVKALRSFEDAYAEKVDALAKVVAERDEWKAKAKEAMHSNPYVGLVRGKHHERMENSDCYCGKCGYPVTDHDSYCRECGGAFHGGRSKAREGQSNLEWLYMSTKYDGDAFHNFVVDMARPYYLEAHPGLGERDIIAHRVGEWLMEKHGDEPQDGEKGQSNLDWLLADHGSVLFTALDRQHCSHSYNDGLYCKLDKAECDYDMCEAGIREWLLSEHVDANGTPNGTCPDGDGTCPDINGTASDSREKLEADICSTLNDMSRFSWKVSGIMKQAKTWLDRQVEIMCKELSAENARLSSDELHYRSECWRLRGEAKELSGKCENQRKELRKLNEVVRELKAANGVEDVLCNGGSARDWYMACQEKDALVEGLERRNVELADEVAELRAQVDLDGGYREKLGRAMDMADSIRGLMP